MAVVNLIEMPFQSHDLIIIQRCVACPSMVVKTSLVSLWVIVHSRPSSRELLFLQLAVLFSSSGVDFKSQITDHTTFPSCKGNM